LIEHLVSVVSEWIEYGHLGLLLARVKAGTMATAIS
jgi:hypothetical protein